MGSVAPIVARIRGGGGAEEKEKEEEPRRRKMPCIVVGAVLKAGDESITF